MFTDSLAPSSSGVSTVIVYSELIVGLISMDPFPSTPVKVRASILPGLIVADVEAGLMVQLRVMLSPGKIDSSDARNL